MSSLWRNLALAALVCSAFGASQTCAQDVAEAARAARERKAAQQNAPHHVYTNDDLNHARILTPQDTLRAASNRTIPADLTKDAMQPRQAAQRPQTPSLGEVARAYRAEKAARHAELAAQQSEQPHYSLELPKTTLAAPKPSVGTLPGSLRKDELLPALRMPAPAPRATTNLRMSPFVPRHIEAPATSRRYVPLSKLVASLRKEEVKRGDSWWRLAKRYLGDGSRWTELLRLNPGHSANPDMLLAGTMVFLPASDHSSPGPPGTRVTVRKGDTFWSLARDYLGCNQAWPQLAAANPEITQFTKLQIGAKLKIPDSSAAVCSAAPALLARK
ncbi:MAG TPA: LysM peptidoglycan-binding domain-containing protein [Candidatus Eisenbacteria bacterium]|nr:LysM peptidoglycan-binding domain-containing protein [Candidatus Eisenbacteria bacterium]